MIISLIGSADAGKTTIINEILKKSPELFQNKEVKYKGDGDIFLVNLYKKVFGTSQTQKFNQNKLYKKRDESFPSKIAAALFNAAYFTSILIDYIFDYIKYEILLRDKILLKDRYIYDFYITFIANFGSKNRLILWVLENFPKPSILFFISVTPENLFARNKNNIEGAITSRKSFFETVAYEYAQLAIRGKYLTIENNAQLASTVSEISEIIKTRIKLANVKTIAVCGPDGAGKTTLVTTLAKKLDSVGIDSYTVHFYHDTILYKLLKLLGFYKDEKTAILQFEKNKAKAEKRKGKRRSFVWGLLNVIDAYLQILIAMIMNRNKILIYDRYFYDFFVSFNYYNVPHYKLLLKYIPRIKKSYVIISRPDILYSRKPENLFAYFEFAYENYRKAADRFEMTIIDTSHTNEKDALNLLWETL